MRPVHDAGHVDGAQVQARHAVEARVQVRRVVDLREHERRDGGASVRGVGGGRERHGGGDPRKGSDPICHDELVCASGFVNGY